VDAANGSDRASGQTTADAFQSAEHAISVASKGDSIYLMPGVHDAFLVDKNGLRISGFPTATIQGGNQGYAILLDATQCNFGAGSVLEDLWLQGNGTGSVGLLASGGGKISAVLRRLEFHQLRIGVQIKASGAGPAMDGQGGRLGGGSGGGSGFGGGFGMMGLNKPQILDCYFGGDGGGIDLPDVAVSIHAGRQRGLNAQLRGNVIQDYPVGIDILGAVSINPIIDDNDILEADTGIHISAGLGSGGNGSIFGDGLIQFDSIRISNNRLISLNSGGGGGGGGDLPPEGISLISAGDHQMSGWIRQNTVDGFLVGIAFSGGDSGGQDLPSPGLDMAIQANVLRGGGGGVDLPPGQSRGILLNADPEMELDSLVENNQIHFFEVGCWVHGWFGANLQLNANSYTDVLSDEVLVNTGP
jgi:hypothetical protein